MGAFAGVLSVIRDVNSKVGPEVAAYRLKDDIAPYKELTADQFEKVEMPERWLSSTAVTDLSQIRGKIAVTQLEKGSLLQTDMIVDRPALEAGQQEIAIMIDASTGVAGKINPGSRVNIYATFEAEDDQAASTSPRSSSRTPASSTSASSPPSTPASPPPNAAGPPPRPSPSPSRSTPPTPNASRTPSRSPNTSGWPWSRAARTRTVAPGDRTYTLDEDK